MQNTLENSGPKRLTGTYRAAWESCKKLPHEDYAKEDSFVPLNPGTLVLPLRHALPEWKLK